jgi:hypothetical protein
VVARGGKGGGKGPGRHDDVCRAPVTNASAIAAACGVRRMRALLRNQPCVWHMPIKGVC